MMTQRWQYEPRPSDLKCVVVGHWNQGKTSLGVCMLTGEAPRDYVPTVFDLVTTPHCVDETEVRLNLFDTAGSEDYDRLRPLAYPGTHCFVLCFAVVDRPNLVKVARDYWPEVMHHVPSAAVLLVGTKIDLRDDPATIDRLATRGESPVSFEEGEALARQIGAVGYLECSAWSGKGVQQVLQAALRAALDVQARPPSRAKKGCALL